MTSAAASCSPEILDRPLITTEGPSAVQKEGGLEPKLPAACVAIQSAHLKASVASHGIEADVHGSPLSRLKSKALLLPLQNFGLKLL